MLLTTCQVMHTNAFILTLKGYKLLTLSNALLMQATMLLVAIVVEK